jgi:alkylation response protein AidB-like acyl-CoA dehydrogenase
MNIIEQDFIELVRQTAREAELRGELPEPVWKQIVAANWLNLYLPADLKGMGMEFPEAVLTLEKLAWLDGALGWTITLCSGAHWFLGFLDKTLRSELLIQEGLCITGSGYAGGLATPLDGGYWIKGEWPHASGVSNATYLTANFSKQGSIVAVLLDRQEIGVVGNWSTMGMKATSSHGFLVKPQWIPSRRFFEIVPHLASHTDPVFQLPFELLASYTLVFNITGMVKRFLELAGHHSRVSTEAFDELRTALLQKCRENWGEVKQGQRPDQQVIKSICAKARGLTQQGLKLVQELYGFQSLSAANEDSELNRVWRNIHTAALHPLLRNIP